MEVPKKKTLFSMTLVDGTRKTRPILNCGKLRLDIKVWEEAIAKKKPKPPPFSNSRDNLNDLSSDRISTTESCKEEIKQTYTTNSLDGGFYSLTRNQTEQALEVNSGPIFHHVVERICSSLLQKHLYFSHFNQRHLEMLTF